MSSLTKSIFFIIDVIVLNLAVLISVYVTQETESKLANAAYLIIFSNVTWLYMVLVSNPYNVNKGWSASRILRSQVIFLIVHFMVVVSLVLFLGQQYSITQIAILYSLFIPLYFLSKVFSYYIRKIFTPAVGAKNYIILGRNQLGEEVRRHYLQNRELGYRFLRYFEDLPEEKTLEQVRLYCHQSEVHEIFCCLPDISGANLKRLVEFGLDSLTKVRIITKTEDRPIKVHKDEPNTLTETSLIPLDHLQNQRIKRIFDVLFSTAFLILIMSWLLPIIAVIIKMDSPGPVFFGQQRSGHENKPFKCLKFRSMRVNHDSDQKQATKNDPRITKLGAFLRKSSIDELPQFFNVFWGDMSVIGPRPHMLKHTEEYSKLIEKFMGRHYVKPGITGLAQCMGYRGETQTVQDMENRVRLDRYYIENWSFWLDIKIIFLTVVSLIRGSDKAY